MKVFLFPVLLLVVFLGNSARSQMPVKSNLVYVDKAGVLRFTKTNAEASFFGVNYTTPFAHAYRAHKAMGVDLEKAIRQDVYHMARLGFNAFRVHVWDTEISDVNGNLLDNENLRLFDFLIAELKERNIHIIITPIAFWGNGYPDRDEATPGFSRKYGKEKVTVNDSAILAQENFLRQFFRHINPYTKQTYTGDPSVIAMEINNEPSHSGPKSGVTLYIDRMAAAVRSTGWTKPIYYNIAQNPWYADAVSKARIDGVTFQWYPTGLVANQEVKGNFLPHVDQYKIPFDTIPEYRTKSKMVYEFDAADVLQSWLYPAIARSFREAGMQWVTQFAYDPTTIANVNTEYQTHYLNLAYTPAKAISMLIAAKAFHKLPRRKSFGSYPADSVFDVFRVSYRNMLSEMNADQEFYYTNSTNTKPKNILKLRQVAGVGNSAIVQYAGSGAYFLDKISDGVWRLEVMPDVVQLRDPFDRTNPKREVRRISWNSNSMQLVLPDLKTDFTIRGLNEGNGFLSKVSGNSFLIQPGTYLVTAIGKNVPANKYVHGKIGMNEFGGPKQLTEFELSRYEPPKTSAATNAVRPDVSRLVIFSPSIRRDTRIYSSMRRGFQSNYITGNDGSAILRFAVTELSAEHTMGFEYYFGDKTEGFNFQPLTSFMIKARTSESFPVKAKITLINRDGFAFSHTIELSNTFRDFEIPLSSFVADSFLLLPRPYPEFLPLWHRNTGSSPFVLGDMERIQITVGSDVPPSEFKKPYSFEIHSVWIEKR